MKFTRQPVEEVSVNMTPLIDVVFLLLIFFMVSTTFTKERELSIDLPQAEGKDSVAVKKYIEIAVSVDGEYAVNGKRLINREAQTLRRAIIDAAEGDNTVPLIIAGDKGAPWQSVVTAMDIAGQLGFSHQSLATQLAE